MSTTTNHAIPSYIQPLLAQSSANLVICDAGKRIVAMSSNLTAALGDAADGYAGKPLTSLPSEYGIPTAIGPVSDALQLYNFDLYPRAMQENQLLLLGASRVGQYMFKYRFDRDELRLLGAHPELAQEREVWRGGPELIAEYLKCSDEDTLYLADVFANAAYGRNSEIDVRSNRDGTPKWMRLTLTPLLQSGHITNTAVGTIQDVTAQKATEERESVTASFHLNALGGISSGWELDLERNAWFFIWNGEPALIGLTNRQLCTDNYDKMMSDVLKSIVHPEDWEEYASIMEREALLASFRRGQRSISLEYRVRNRAGANATYEWRNMRVRFSRDTRTMHPKVSCYTTNISAQKANELEAQRERAKMERTARSELASNARKSQFLADTARTLNAPMRAMIGIAQLALTEDMSDTAREYVAQLRDFGEDLSRILTDVLDLSGHTGNEMPSLAEYSATELMDDIRHTLQLHNVTDDMLHIEIDPAMPSRMYGDNLRLRQVLVNLAGTVFEACDGRTINIRFSSTEPDSEQVTFIAEVVDPYNTLNENELRNLFVAFNMSPDRYGCRTGLGLSLAKQLVSLMNGTLEASSPEGGSVCFRVCVPQRVIDTRPIGS